MKEIFYSKKVFVFLLLFVMAPAHAGTTHHIPASLISVVTDPRATFEKIWVDYDVLESNLKGMRIHVKFSVYDMKNLDSYVAIYFKDKEGRPLKDRNKKFYSESGDVAVYKYLKPGYDEAMYNDLSVFMPYDELDLDPGAYDLKMAIDLIYKSGGLIQHLTAYEFAYSNTNKKTEPAPSNAGSTSAAYKTMWVDYDMEENGKWGMRIHLKFEVYNMKDTDGYVAIYFAKRDGTKLYTNSTSYSSRDGQVALYKSIRPEYAQAVYNDLVLFMPYQEFNLSPGKYNLTMEVNLIFKNGGIISPLTSYNFLYEKK
jgi:hypothetical protein